MPLNAQELTIPGFGGDPGQGLNALSNKLWMRNIQTQRLQLAQEGKREQAGNFLREYLDPKQYLTGTQFDPVINGQLQQTMQKGAALAAGGADIPTILQSLGPDVQNLSDYSNKAKIVKAGIDNGVKQMRESGVRGVDFDKAAYRAQTMAFHAQDASTGQDIGIKHPADVDEGANWLHEAIIQHPDEVMTGGDVDAYAKALPAKKTLADIKGYDAGGNENAKRVHLVAPESFVPETDARGATTGMVPRYETATSGGQPLMHNFTDAQGNKTQAPVRLMDEGDFDEMLHQKPLIANYFMGQVKQHWPEYEGNQPYDPNSPDAKRLARAFAYDEIKKQTPTAIENAEIQNKPSAAEVQVHYFGGKEQQSYDRAYGAAAGKSDAADDGYLAPGAKNKINTVDALTRTFNNDPLYNTGPGAVVNGRNVVNITQNLPKAGLKFGKGAGDVYKNVYRDVSNNSLILEKKDPAAPKVEVPASQAQSFLSSIAEANGVPLTYVPNALKKAGFNNGTFTNALPGDELQKGIDAKAFSAHYADVNKGTDELMNSGKSTTLKGMQTPDGIVTSVQKNSKWNPFSKNYSITSKDASGKETEQQFNTKAEMQAYLVQHPQAAKPTAPAAQPGKGKYDTP